MPIRKSSKKIYKKRVYRKKRAIPRAPKSQFATCVETLPLTAINVNTPYILSKAGITGGRAPAMAALYGFYRIARLTYTYTPLYDTYASALPATGNFATQVPQLYWQMNRFGDAPATFDGNFMRSHGSKPNRLDDKNIVVSYKPNMLLVGEDNSGNNASQIKMTPWISTDVRPGDQTFSLSTAEHFGHLLFVEAAASGTTNGPVCNMNLTVVYEFKTPRVPASVTSDLVQVSASTLSL